MNVPEWLRPAIALSTAPARPIVIVGAGGIARDAHLPAYAEAGFEVAAIADLDLSRAQALAQRFGVPSAVATLSAAIRSAPANVVYDVTVPAPALRTVLRQLPDGAAVLLQKPMGETLAEAIEIVGICREKALTAAVNFQLRWAPNMLAARALHATGKLGPLHDVEVRVSAHQPWEMWSFLATAPRLEILYHSIHYIDLVRSWFGNPAGVWAQSVKTPTTPALAATRSVIVMNYGPDRRVLIHTNHSHAFHPRMQQSYVQWEGPGGAMRAGMGVNLDYPRGRPDSFEYILQGDPDWTSEPMPGEWFPDAFIGSMGSLQAYVLGEETTLPTSVEDALDTMRTVEAAYRSSEQGGVPLPII